MNDRTPTPALTPADDSLISGFVVTADGQVAAVGGSLAEAKTLGMKHVVGNTALTISSFAAPAPSQRWDYDYEIADWVEKVPAR